MTYGKNTYISRASAYQRNRNVVTISSSKNRMGPITNIIVLVLILCLLGLMYLTQITKTNSLGYKVSNLSSQQEELQEEYESLQVETTRLQSLERVKSSPVAKNLSEVKPSTTVVN